MEPQDNYSQLIEGVYTERSPKVTSSVNSIIQQVREQPDQLRLFLTELCSTRMHSINFRNWTKFARMLVRTILPKKDKLLEKLLAQYFVHAGHYFFPYYITLANHENIKEFLKICCKIQIPAPEKYTDQLHIIMHLQGTYEGNWANGLIDVINSSVLVDKKNQVFKSLKINPYFAEFVVANIEKLQPQLERLLVRSESNIEIWADFFENLRDLCGMEKHVMTLLKKNKNIYLNHKDISIRLVNALTGSLKEEKVFAECFEFIKGLVSNEHNSKKKIIYFQMLNGLVRSASKYHKDTKLPNQILVLVINSWIKFTEEEEANQVFAFLQTILPLVTIPTDEIAAACKSSLKNQNKFIQIFLYLTLSKIYNKPNHFEEFPAVKEIYGHAKTQLATYFKKVEATWHFLFPLIHFISNNDLSHVENLRQIHFLLRDSCLALNNIQKVNAIRTFILYLHYLKKEAQQELLNVQSQVCLSLCVLLEEVSNRQVLTLLKQIDEEAKRQLITKGLFGLLFYGCEKTQKNKGNRFISLGQFLFASLKEKISLESKDLEKYIICCSLVNYPFKKIIDNKEEKSESEKQHLTNLLDKYLKLILFDSENNDKIVTYKQHLKIFQSTTDILLRLIYSPSINNILAKFLNSHYYLEDLNFINEVEAESIETVQKYLDEFAQIRQELLEKGFITEVKVEQKKVYFGQMLDVKMMSEDEVKEEKYRQHFEKMLLYFDKLVNLILRNVQNNKFLEHVWKENFDNLIGIVRFPHHRIPIYRIVKMSCEVAANTSPQAKIFLKYSLFFGEFFSVRGAYITPTVKLMEKCHTFLKLFLTVDPKNLRGYLLMLVNDMCEYILDNMEFDVSLKRLTLAFYNESYEKQIRFKNEEKLYTYLVKNINILSSCDDMEVVLGQCMKVVNPHRYGEMFLDILSFISVTKKLILKMVKNPTEHYEPEFEDYIKLRILSLETNQDIAGLAQQILKNSKSQKKAITNFNMKGFIKKNSKEIIQKLCQFITESISSQNIDEVFKLVLVTAEQLFDQHFDQEGLQFFPYFLSLNIDNIPGNMFKPIFELLIMKYTAIEEYVTLSRLSVDIGILIIKKYAPKQGEKLLLTVQGFLNRAKGISNIIFLGVLAPYLKGNKNLQLIEQRITELFKGSNHSEQSAIAKCMPDLMSFFKEPEKIIKKIFENIGGLEEKLQIGQSYLAAGLLKGIGAEETLKYLDIIISSDYVSKTKSEKTGRCSLLNAFIDNFGRVVQLRIIQIIQILIQYMSDSNEHIREQAKKVVQSFIPKISSFAVKTLLPYLLMGLQNEQNWRIKISYIWILGIMANCSAKQLQASLPVIVPTLSNCLSNAHPTIRDKAAEALSLIGETIKNPQISNSIDILIEALQNPFQKSSKAIDILLKMKFAHYIDPPSLSLIIPIVDYCLRGRVSELKEGACQVIGSVSELIQNPSDMLPYLKIISSGLRTAICDPLSEIRGIAAMAIGKISSKIGAEDAEKYFSFVLEMIESLASNTTEKSGAAQSYAEIICSQDYQYFEESLNHIFDKLNEVKHTQKQGYLLVFLYVPSIRKEQFEGFIKEVNENMYIFVSDDEESMRNSAMQVAKVLINSYSLSHTDLLLEPLCEGVFQSNWRKRNAALILIGEMLNIIKSYMFHTKNSDKTYAYYKGLMAVYILKDDELEMPRVTAFQVWNAYIENTPKTIKSGLRTLVEMWTRFTHSANGIVLRNIVGFSGKYGQNYFLEIMEYLQEKSSEPLHKKGVFEVLGELIKRLHQQFLMKDNNKRLVKEFFQEHIFTISDDVRFSLSQSFALFIEKLHEEEYFESLLYPRIDKMENLSEQQQQYTDLLHLVRDLLHTSSNRVVNRLISKIMQPPLSEFKIEVITNNADKVANNLYTLFKNKPATELMLSEILMLIENGQKANRLSLLVYCLNQISTKLQNNYKSEYIKMLINSIRVNSHKENTMKVIEKLFEMTLFFLNSISLSEIQTLESLIGEVAPFIFKGTQKVTDYGHKIFLILISDPKGSQTGLYYRQLIVTLQNNKSHEKIWKDASTVKDYISTLVKGLAYGNNDIMEDSLEMLKFMIKSTDTQIIKKQIVRIMGPVIRVANYSLQHRQKEKLLEFIQQIYESEYNIEIYSHQVVSVCLRLLSEYKSNKSIEEIIKLIASTIFHLIKKSERHSNIINNLVHKVKFYGEPLVRTLYYLFKIVLNEKPELFAKTLLETTHQEFHSLLTHNQFRLPVKGLYYVSKTAARISCFLGYPIEKYEEQLEGVTCSYQIMLNYLHHAYYAGNAVPKLTKLELYIQQCPRQKVYYLLKSLKLCRKKNNRTKGVYTREYVGKLVPETLSGFEDIIDVLEEFE